MARKRKRDREPRSLGAAPADTKALVAPQAAETAAPRTASWQVWAAAGLIIAAGTAAYANSFRGVFQFDDARLLKAAGMQRLWPPWESMFYKEFVTRPVVGFTLAANYAIGRLQPWGYHAVNLAVHILAGLVLFGLARRTLAGPRLRERIGGAATALALSMTLLWLLHPLQTESVTYVTQRAEALMGLFFLLTLYCAARAFAAPLTLPCPQRGEGKIPNLSSPQGGEGRVRGRGWQIAALTACALGMGCKQVMVTAPLLVLLYDRTFAAGSFKAALQRRRRFYAGLAATWLILAAELAFMPKAESAGFGMAHLTPAEYACAQPGVLLHYLRLVFWPDRLCLDYDWPKAGSVGEIVLPALPLVLLLAATIRALWRAPAWGFLGAWFFLILAPTSSVMPIADLAFEHRMYLSLAALAGAVSAAIFLAGRKLLAGRVGALVGGGLAGLLCLGLAWRTIQRNRDYASEAAMWTQVVEQRPNNARAQNNLADALSEAGRLEDALAHYRRAIAIKPDYADAYCNMGYVLVQAGRPEEALAHFRKAIEINPGDARAYNNLGVELGKKGRQEEAIALYRKALEVDPDHGEAHNNLGSALSEAGQLEEALAHCRKVIAIKPDYAGAHSNLGIALGKAGRLEEALAEHCKAVALEPGSPDFQSNLGNELVKAGQPEEALAHCRKAIAINPDFAPAHNSLGMALDRLGRPEEAIAAYQEAIRLKPDYADAHNNLGYALGKARRLEDALGKARRLEDAIAHCRKAIEIKPAFAEAHNNLGIALAKAGRQEEAIAEFKMAAQVQPDFANAYNNLGNALDEAGRLEEAVTAYGQALRLQPDYANAHANLADTLNKLGRAEESATHAREAARLKAAVEAKK